MSDRFELKISDKVKIVIRAGNYTVLATVKEAYFDEDKKKRVKPKPDEYYYNALHQAVNRGLHVASELENPDSVEKYLELLETFRDEVLSTADFVEHKYKVVCVAP